MTKAATAGSPHDQESIRPITRILYSSDISAFVYGKLQVADRTLYTFRADEMRWLADYIESLRNAAQRAPALRVGRDSSDYDLESLSISSAKSQLGVRRVVVTLGARVPNYSLFRLRKPLIVTTIDGLVLVAAAVLALSYFDWAVLGATVTAWVALRETGNAVLRSLMRRAQLAEIAA